jgi:hypothetical protein
MARMRATSSAGEKGFVGAGGEHYDVGIGRTSELPQHLHTAEFREHPVEDDDVGRDPAGHLKRRPTVECLVHLESLSLQVQAQEPHQVLLVFDYERADRHGASADQSNRSRTLDRRA